MWPCWCFFVTFRSKFWPVNLSKYGVRLIRVLLFVRVIIPIIKYKMRCTCVSDVFLPIVLLVTGLHWFIQFVGKFMALTFYFRHVHWVPEPKWICFPPLQVLFRRLKQRHNPAHVQQQQTTDLNPQQNGPDMEEEPDGLNSIEIPFYLKSSRAFVKRFMKYRRRLMVQGGRRMLISMIFLGIVEIHFPVHTSNVINPKSGRWNWFCTMKATLLHKNKWLYNMKAIYS